MLHGKYTCRVSSDKRRVSKTPLYNKRLPAKCSAFYKHEHEHELNRYSFGTSTYEKLPYEKLKTTSSSGIF